MPGFRIKSFWGVALFLLLLLAFIPRPAAGGTAGCSARDEVSATLPATEAEPSATAQSAEPVDAAPADADKPESPAAKKRPTGGAHRPRTTWPEMVPLGN